MGLAAITASQLSTGRYSVARKQLVNRMCECVYSLAVVIVKLLRLRANPFVESTV
jgi:hypothetical protein